MVITNECFCWELEMGGRILAWLGIVYHGFYTLFYAHLTRLISYITSIFALHNDISELLSVIVAISLVQFLIYLALFILSVLLNIGIKSKKSNYIFPSFIIAALETGLDFIITLIIYFYSTPWGSACLVRSIIQLYITFVFYSLYQKIRDEENPRSYGA